MECKKHRTQVNRKQKPERRLWFFAVKKFFKLLSDFNVIKSVIYEGM